MAKGVDDMTALQDLNEDSLLENLKIRYTGDIIYVRNDRLKIADQAKIIIEFWRL
jgi:hypothetical protein